MRKLFIYSSGESAQTSSWMSVVICIIRSVAIPWKSIVDGFHGHCITYTREADYIAKWLQISIYLYFSGRINNIFGGIFHVRLISRFLCNERCCHTDCTILFFGQFKRFQFMLQTIQSGFYPLTGDFILRFGTITTIIMSRSPPQIDLRTFLKEFLSTYGPALNEARLLVEHNIYTIIINTYFIRFLLYSQLSAIFCVFFHRRIHFSFLQGKLLPCDFKSFRCPYYILL